MSKLPHATAAPVLSSSARRSALALYLPSGHSDTHLPVATSRMPVAHRWQPSGPACEQPSSAHDRSQRVHSAWAGSPPGPAALKYPVGHSSTQSPACDGPRQLAQSLGRGPVQPCSVQVLLHSRQDPAPRSKYHPLGSGHRFRLQPRDPGPLHPAAPQPWWQRWQIPWPVLYRSSGHCCSQPPSTLTAGQTVQSWFDGPVHPPSPHRGSQALQTPGMAGSKNDGAEHRQSPRPGPTQ